MKPDGWMLWTICLLISAMAAACSESTPETKPLADEAPPVQVEEQLAEPSVDPPPESFTLVASADPVALDSRAIVFEKLEGKDEESIKNTALPQNKDIMVIRSASYSLTAPKGLKTITGFKITRLPPSKAEPGYIHKDLQQIALSLSNGPQEIFSRQLVLISGKPESLWMFQFPYPVHILEGAKLTLKLDIVQPKDDPTQSAPMPDSLALVVPLSMLESANQTVMTKLPKAKDRVCFSNNKKQLSCFYASGVAIVYLEQRPGGFTRIGSWQRVGNTLRASFESGQVLINDRSKAKTALDLGSFGKDWTPFKGKDPRAHRFYDLASRVKKGKKLLPGDIKSVTMGQFIEGGTTELAAKLKDGGVAIFARPNPLSGMDLLHRIERPGAKLRLIWDPTERKGSIALKKKEDVNWEIYRHVFTSNTWERFETPQVPWDQAAKETEGSAEKADKTDTP